MGDPEEQEKNRVVNNAPVQNQFIGDYPTIIQQVPNIPNRSSKDEQNNRASLVKRMENFMDDILQPLLPQDTWMELRLQEQPSALDNPPPPGLGTGKQTSSRVIGTSIDIAQIFHRYEQLLILGEPGAGKTTLLCYLAKELLKAADAENPIRGSAIPVYLHLSTWARQKVLPDKLDQWVVSELRTWHGVNKRIGKRWVKDNQLVLLLDGLDEVVSEARATCIKAINRYIENSKRLVVCCRSEEYQLLFPTLSLRGQAISIFPLTPQEVESYISAKKGRIPGLKETLSKDATLAKMASSPLILDLLLQAPQSTIDLSAELTPEEIEQKLLDSYVKKANLSDKEKHWLIVLAKQLKDKNDTLFRLEWMQPTWLPKGYWRAVYLSLIGALFGAIIGMICFTLLGAFIEGLSSLLAWFHPWSLDTEIAVPLAALLLGGPTGGIIGLFIGLVCPLEWVAINPAEETSLSWQQKVYEIIPFLVVAITGELVCLPIRAATLAQPFFLMFIQLTKRVSITALPGGIVIWIIYELINALIGSLTYIGNSFLFLSLKGVQRESFLGSCQSIWSCARRGGKIGLVIGVFDTLFGGFLGGPVYYNVMQPWLKEDLFTLKGALLIGFASGVLSWFAVGLLTITSRERLDKSDGRVVNQGIRRSLRYSMLAVVGFWIAFWLIYQFVSGLDFKLIEGIILGFAFCLIPGLMNGGAACIKHAILRYLLRRAKCIPRNYTDFLDRMVVRDKYDPQKKRKNNYNKMYNHQEKHKERRILQEIGGGYMFTYGRPLLYYFENLKDPISPPQQKTLQNGDDFPHQLLIRMIAGVVVFLIITSSVSGGIYFFQHRLDRLVTRCNSYTSTHANNGKGLGASYGLGVTLGLALYHVSYDSSTDIEEHIFYTEAALKDALPYANTLIRRGVPLNLGGVNGLRELADCPQIGNDILISYNPYRGRVYRSILAIRSKYASVLQRFSYLYDTAYQLGTDIALARGLASDLLSNSRSSINSYLKEAQKLANILGENQITLNISELQSIIDKIYIMGPSNLYSKIISSCDEYQIQLDTAPM